MEGGWGTDEAAGADIFGACVGVAGYGGLIFLGAGWGTGARGGRRGGAIAAFGFLG